MVKKILLIDDSEFILESTSTLLMFEGYEVITADNGEDGIKMAIDEMPDLIICDVSMPGFSGYDVVEKIRATTSTLSIPFIFLTAFTEKSKMREGMEKGANDYLTKPFTKKELIAAINSQWKSVANVETKVASQVEIVGKKLNYALPHEFRTVISQLLNSVTVLRDNIEILEKSDVVEVCDQMSVIIKRLNRITENFLLFTKLENYANSPDSIEELRSAQVDEPFAIINDVAENVAVKYDRISDIVELNATFDISVSMASDLFHRLVDEILDNAFKFSHKGSIVSIDSTIKGDKFYVIVADLGKGMSKEQLKSLGAFMQMNREKNEQQGVGIGLSIAKKIVELHDGTFEISSELNKGTSIEFSVPLRK